MQEKLLSNKGSSVIAGLPAETILDLAPVGIFQVDDRGTIVTANATALNILNMDRGSIEGRAYKNLTWSYYSTENEVLNLDDLPVLKALKEGVTVKEHIYGIKIGKEKIWVSETCAPLYDQTRVLIGCISSFYDVPGEFQRSGNNTSTKAECSKGSLKPIFWERALPEGKFTCVSTGVQEILGYSTKEFLKKGFWESHIHPQDRERVVSFHQDRFFRGIDCELEYRFRKRKGDYVWMKDTGNVVFKKW